MNPPLDQRPRPLELAALCMCDADYQVPHCHLLAENQSTGWYTDVAMADDGCIGVAGTDDEVTADPPGPVFDDAVFVIDPETGRRRNIGAARRQWRALRAVSVRPVEPS